MSVRIRPAAGTETDVRFLQEMLYLAATWRPDRPHRSRAELLSDPKIAVYLAGWPRAADAGVLAEDTLGAPLGAAWYRLFDEVEPGYGFIDTSIPELTVGVRPEARGRGVGTALLRELIQRARLERLPALSLSVEEDNPAVRLYERLGFVPVGRDDKAWTMRLDLDTA